MRTCESILVFLVDRDNDFRENLAVVLRNYFGKAIRIRNFPELHESKLNLHLKPDLVVLDGTDTGVLEFQHELRRKHPRIQTMVMIEEGNVERVVELMKAGASDCLEKNNRTVEKIKKGVQEVLLSRTLQAAMPLKSGKLYATSAPANKRDERAVRMLPASGMCYLHFILRTNRRKALARPKKKIRLATSF